MSFNIAFLIILAISIALLLRLKQRPIVAFGGSFIIAAILALAVAKPERNHEAPDANLVAQAVSKSNDHAIYREMFEHSAAKLIQQGKCSIKDFQNIGGWLRAHEHKRPNTYFTYCGGSTVPNRIYLDAQNGELFR